MAQKILNGVHISGTTQLDFMPTHESEGIITLGRFDSNTSRYHNIKSYVSSTEASNYLKFSLHNGTSNTVVDVLTLKGNGYVGIGKAVPQMSLHVNSAENGVTAIGVSNTSSGASRVYLDASNGDFSGSDYMWIGQNNDLSGEIFMAQNAGTFHIKTQPGGTSTSQFSITQAGLATFAGDINITNDILPVNTGASDLGTDAKRFGSLFTNGAFIGTLTSTNIQLQGDLKILNKAQTAYIGFATKNTSGSETVMDITNAGSATFAGDITLGANKIGRDAHNFIDFSIDNHITFKTAESTAVQIDSNLSLKVIAGSLQISGDNANFVTLTESGSGDFTIDAPDDIRLDAGGGDIVLKGDGSEYGRLSNSSQDFIIKNITENKDIKFEGNDGNGTSGTNITALRLDMSDNGWAHFSGGLAVGPGTSTFAGDVTLSSGSPVLKIEAKNANSFVDPYLEFVTWNVASGASGGKIALTSGAWNNNEMAFSVEVNNSVTEKMRINSYGVGIGMTPAEVLDLKAASGDTRIRLDAASGSDTEIKFFNAGAAQYTIGHDDASDEFRIALTNVEVPMLSFTKSKNATFAGNIVTEKLHDYDTIPPNQNLLDIGSIKIAGRNDIYGNATKTVISDYVAKYVNDNTGETTVRIYVDDNILVDGDPYMVSVYYENLIGTLGIDFADTAVTGNGGQTGTSSAPKSGRIYGHATRADYTSTFRFLDINLNQGAGHEVTLHSPKVEAGTTLTDFVATERTDMPTNSMHIRELIATSDATFEADVLASKILFTTLNGHAHIDSQSTSLMIEASNIQAMGNLIPDGTGNRNLGASNRYWAETFTNGVTSGGNITINSNTPVINLGVVNTSTGNARVNFYSKNSTAANAFALEYNKTSTVDRLEFIDGSGNANIKFNNGGSASFAGTVLSSGILVGQASAYSPTGGGDTLATFAGSGSDRQDIVVSNQTNNASAAASLVLATHGHDFIIKGTSAAGGSVLSLGFNTNSFLSLTSSDATFGGDVKLNTGKSLYLNGTTGLRLLHDGSNAHIINGGTGDLNFKNDASNKDIYFSGIDGVAQVTALTLDMSENGKAIFSGDVVMGANNKLYGGRVTPRSCYQTTPVTGFLIETDISATNYAMFQGRIVLEQFNVNSKQVIEFSATGTNVGAVHASKGTADINTTIKLFVYNSKWYIHVPGPSTYTTCTAFINKANAYQGHADAHNAIVNLTAAAVPSSGVSGSVDIVCKFTQGDVIFVGKADFEKEVTISDIVDGPFTALRLMNQKSYGSGTGTNEKVRFVMGISESGIAFSGREGFAIDLGIADQSDSSNGVVDFKVRDGGTLGTYSTVTGSNKSVSFVGAVTASSFTGDGSGLTNVTSSNVPSHNHDDRYYTETELNAGQLDNRYYTETESNAKFTSTDATGDNYTFEIEDEGNLSGNRWYHVATIYSGNGGLHIRGAMLNHVENFASQKFDLAMQVREAGDGGQLEIAGTVDVLHNNSDGSDKCGIRVIKTADNAVYDDFKVYVRTTRYQMLTLRLTQQGLTTFNTSHSSPLTSEPAPVSGGHVEIDTSTLLEGHHTIIDSAAKLTVANASATFANDITVGALTSGKTAQLVVNQEGGVAPVAKFMSRTNKAIVQISDNDTTGYVSSENGYFSMGRAAGVNAANINVDGSNNVGMGISGGTAEKLHVYNAGTARIEIEGTTGPAAFKATNSQGSFGWYVPSDANEFRLFNFGTSADIVEVGASGNTTFAGRITHQHKKYCDVSISNSYVRVYATGVTNSQLATIVRLTGTSHGSSHVGTFTAKIMVGHYQDVQIESMNGFYPDDTSGATIPTLKVEGDGNGQYTLSMKTSSTNAATYYFTIESLSDQTTISTLPSSTASTTISHLHDCVQGKNLTHRGHHGSNKIFKIQGDADFNGTLNVVNHANTSSVATQFMNGRRHSGTVPIGELIFSNDNDSVATVAGYRDGANDKGSLLFQTQNGSSGFGTRLTIKADGVSTFEKNLKTNESLFATGDGSVFGNASGLFVDSASTNYNIQAADGIAFGGAAFTFANMFGDDFGNITLAANAYPANTGSESKITFKTSTQSGGSFTPLKIKGNTSTFAGQIAGQGGTDLVTNGSFSGVSDGTDVASLTGWSAYGSVTSRNITSEQLVLVTTGANSGALLTVTTVVGQVYHVTSDTSGDTGNNGIHVDTTAEGAINHSTKDGVDFYFTAAATSTLIYFRASTNGAGTANFDNVSVKEVVGYHLGDGRLNITKLAAGDAKLKLVTTSGGDPNITFNSKAANRSAVINFQDVGVQSGQITYKHNGDTMEFYTGGASSAGHLELQLNETNGATFRTKGTFGGTLKTSGNLQIINSAAEIWIGDSLAGTDGGFIKWNSTSDYLYIGNSYGSAFNEDIKIDNTGKVTLGGNIQVTGEFTSNVTVSGGGGNTLLLKKGTGTPAIALGGTSGEASALIEGTSGGGLKIYTSTSTAGTIADPGWSPKITLAQNGNLACGPVASPRFEASGINSEFKHGTAWGMNLRLTNTNDDASPPVLTFLKQQASGHSAIADDDYVGFTNYRMKNTNGDEFSWVELSALACDVTDGSESSKYRIGTWGDGTEYANTITAFKGNVGIGGVANPTTSLQVGDGVGNKLIKVHGASTAGIQLFTGGGSGSKIAFLEQHFSNEGVLGLKHAGTTKVFFRANSDCYINSGRLAIGHASASATLDARCSVNNAYSGYFYNSDTQPYSHGLNVQTATTNANAYAFRVNSGSDTNALVVKGDAKVGIGIATPHTTLQVNGSASAMNAHFGQGQNNSSSVFGGISLGYAENGNANYRKVGVVAKARGDGAARQDFHILVDIANDQNSAGIADSKLKIDGLTGNTSVTGSMTASGDVVAFSDKKLKENIKTLDGSKVLKMRGVSFTRKDTGENSSGVIAQEIEKIAPELVSETNGTLGVAYGNLVGYLIEAVKDQQKQIDELKKQIK